MRERVCVARLCSVARTPAARLAPLALAATAPHHAALVLGRWMRENWKSRASPNPPRLRVSGAWKVQQRQRSELSLQILHTSKFVVHKRGLPLRTGFLHACMQNDAVHACVETNLFSSYTLPLGPDCRVLSTTCHTPYCNSPGSPRGGGGGRRKDVGETVLILALEKRSNGMFYCIDCALGRYVSNGVPGRRIAPTIWTAPATTYSGVNRAGRGADHLYIHKAAAGAVTSCTNQSPTPRHYARLPQWGPSFFSCHSFLDFFFDY